MADVPIPVGFRAETLQQVVRLLRSGESCAVVGVGSSGKSNVARHLARADVRQEYFGPEADSTLIVYLNCKPLARRAPHDLYLHALDQMARALAENEGALHAHGQTVEALWQAAEGQPEGLARRNLDQAVGLLAQAGARRIVVVLDDCDDLFALAPPVLFADLRGLRDNYKQLLVYLTLTRREPVFLRTNASEFEELFELLSAPGHTIPVAPYLEADGLLMLRRLAQRQAPPRSLSESEALRLNALAGGHAGLLRALFFATQYTPTLAADALSPEQWVHLAEHADVEGECAKIWDSLEPEEQTDLGLVVRGEVPSRDGARRLERRGLVHVRLNGRTEIFSPIFERYIGNLLKARAAARPPERTDVEFVGIGRQVRVNGSLVTLLAPEYEILRCLTASRPEPCSRMQLIEAMRLAEHVERSEKIAGDPLRRLHEYVRQLKAKIGPAGPLIQPGGDGYRLAELDRPA
jgi:hypothetical protein